MNEDIDGWICRVVRGCPAEWRFASHEEALDMVRARCALHGTTGLLFYFGKRNPLLPSWPEDLRSWLSEQAKWLAINEAVRAEELKNVLVALAGSEIDVLQLKGTPLAYQHYPEPWLRIRGDTDILIRENDRETVDEVLKGMGYDRRRAITGELVSYQASYSRRNSHGIAHVLDIHWKLSNWQIIAGMFSFDELKAASRPVLSLGVDTRSLGPVHALLHAMMHRAVHRHTPYYVEGAASYEGNRLIWLYDIHLLATDLKQHDWAELLALAAERRTARLAQDALLKTQACFATDIPDEVWEQLAILATRDEPTAALLEDSKLKALYANFKALPRKQRLRWMAETALPSSDYLLWKYQTEKRWLLPYLYVHRACAGMLKQLQRPRGLLGPRG